MALITTPQNREYDAGFETVFGRKCFYCKKFLDQSNAEEWETSAHVACEKAANEFREEATTEVISNVNTPALGTE